MDKGQAVVVRSETRGWRNMERQEHQRQWPKLHHTTVDWQDANVLQLAGGLEVELGPGSHNESINSSSTVGTAISPTFELPENGSMYLWGFINQIWTT